MGFLSLAFSYIFITSGGPIKRKELNECYPREYNSLIPDQ